MSVALVVSASVEPCPHCAKPRLIEVRRNKEGTWVLDRHALSCAVARPVLGLLVDEEGA
jgi:hypothetical protein